MSKSQIIRGAIRLCQLLIGIAVILAVVLAYALIDSSYHPDQYQHVVLTDTFRAGWGVRDINLCWDCASPKDILMSQLSDGMRLWLAIRSAFFLTMSYLIIRRIFMILRSVHGIETFYPGNIKHFRQLALYGLIAAFVSTFNFYNDGVGTNWNLTIPFGPLSFSLACLVLSEIFKEGQSLEEDKASIV